ncbi:hypothetical protein [Natronosalvus rutilus]|uniref:Uncharacterized protein n=1 Tax=Natronosalvus rutilus TaxID=2953753 RepID=A0A9E7N767_9EURY|nr:hypothetical protein [Natronosalvus rutilus]UTF52755.1 hypothetical protein NGM29_13310 [Natronosalvus rutilus]
MNPAADALPDDPLDWLFERLQDVVWADDPRRQIAANMLLFIIALVSSTVTLGATLVLAFVFLSFGSIGVARFVWHLVRG